MKNMSIALADSILTRFPDPDTIPWRRWCYVQGYVLAAFEKLCEYTGDSKYFDYLKKFVDQHVTADGNIRDFTGDNLDDIMAGTAIVAVYEKTGEQKYRLAADSVRRKFDDYPRNSDGGFWHSRSLPHEMWIDGVFMGQMFLTRYGAVIGDQDYCFDEATRQIVTLADHCRKVDSGLFLHAYDEARSVTWADPQTGLSPEVWSEGLGWYALILVETVKLMPLTHPGRSQVMSILQDLIEGLKKTQDASTGLWYQVVDKGERADNWHDTSGSAMFVYAIQRAADLGYVSAEKYAPVAKRGYEGLLTKAVIRPDGLVDIYDACDGVCVQRSYEDYINFPKTVNAKEAVGGFLWASVIVEKPTRS
jgi:rhamnogalacturonyl hydrolase YesR